MMSDPIVRVQAEAPPVDVAVQTDVPDVVVRIEVANQGKDGYTPKRGVDYWTEEDVQEIRDYVDGQIGTGSDAVSSVNGKTGAVMLAPEDIGAQPKGDYALKEEVPQIDDAAVSAESTWSSKNTVERFLPEFSESGAAVECHPFPLCPLNVSTTFEPAQAGSGDPYPAGGGKNLLPFAVTGNTVTARGITVTFDNEGCVINGTPEIQYPSPFAVNKSEYPLEPGNYYISGGKKPDFYLQIEVTRNGTKEWHTNKSFTIYGDETGYRISITCAKEAGTITFDNYRIKPMLVKGTEAPEEYQPYSNIRPISGYDSLEFAQADKTENKNTYTVHLGDAVYGGTYDWSKGELVVEWKMLPLNGTEAFATSSSWESKYGFYCDGLMSDSVKVAGYDTIANIKCSHAGISTPSRITHDVSSSVAVGQGVETRLYVCLGEFPTVADFKAFLAAQYVAGTPVQIAYKLAEPITIRLAPLEIMPLDGTNVLISNPGNTTVSGKLDPIYLHEQNKTAAAKLAGMETRLRALESAAVNNA